MDKATAIEMLKQCLEEIPHLKGLQYDNSKFELWRDKVEQIIRSSLSQDDFQTFISTNLLVPVIDFLTPNNVRQNYYLERLVEYGVNIEKIIQKYEILGVEEKPGDKVSPSNKSQKSPVEQRISLSASRTNWEAIESEYGVTKRSFGKNINFVSESHKRKIIFRDVEHSFVLASLGFSKPAVILAGGVIEELLRLYLKHKNITPISNSFDGYIQTCELEGLIKAGISRLSDSARHFRNLVHLSREETKKHTISKATAIGAVSSLFTIANDF